MNEETLLDTLGSLGNALDRFGEALAHPDPYTASPKSTLRHAYRRGLVDREQLWLNMLVDHNRSSHSYNAKMAREIFGRLPSHYRELRDCFEQLKLRVAED